MTIKDGGDAPSAPDKPVCKIPTEHAFCCGIQSNSSLHKFLVNLFTNSSLLPLLTDQTANNFERASALALAKPTLIDFLEAKRSHSETLWMKYCSSRRNVRRARVLDHDYRTRHKRHLCRPCCQKSFVATTPRPSNPRPFFVVSFSFPFWQIVIVIVAQSLEKKTL